MLPQSKAQTQKIIDSGNYGSILRQMGNIATFLDGNRALLSGIQISVRADDIRLVRLKNDLTGLQEELDMLKTAKHNIEEQTHGR